ncbi:MAG: sulfate permease, partial [Pseudomonadota bacterium]
MTHTHLVPRLLAHLRDGYTPGDLSADALAGLAVAIVSLPLAMALAIASGVTPERGLFTAIVAGLIISVFGGSRVQIGGPTGAFVVIVYAVVERHGYNGLITATFMAGLLLIALGLARFGRMIKFIPYPVTTGFTAGIAVVIFSSQIKDFLGLSLERVPSQFMAKWGAYLDALHTASLPTVGVGCASLLALIAFRRWAPRMPASLIVVIGAAAVVSLGGLPVETIGSRFGEIPQTLPAPAWPPFDLSMVGELIPAALTIALLAGVESLLSAVVADGMTGDRHSSDMELVAQGAANVASVFFGGIPATGAIARTAMNVRSGARTPIAGVLHALFLLSFMVFLAPYLKLVPLTTLAAILFVVAWNMAHLDHFRRLFKAPPSDTLVLLASFGLTVLVDLTVAVEVGVVLAALLFMKRM